MKGMRKFLAVAALGVVELAAFVVADPRDLPPWVVTGALAINAAAVYIVRNQPPKTMAPTLFAHRPARKAEPEPEPEPERPRE
jgi:hypothetical protein